MPLALALGACVALLTPPDKPAAIASIPRVVKAEPAAAPPQAPARTRVLNPLSITPSKIAPETVAPAFVEIEEGFFEARTPRYHASLSATEGLTYRPLAAGQTQNNLKPTAVQPELRLRLKQVTRGENSVFKRLDAAVEDPEIAVDDDDGSLSFWRAPGFEEHYRPRGDGVEQSFILEDRIDGNGALAFESDLKLTGLTPLPARANRKGGIIFVDELGQFATRLGQIVVRDAAQQGLVIEPELSADHSRIAFAIPGDWLDKAKYPVLVDPLVGGDFLLSADNTVGVGAPTVVAGNTSFLVIWNDYRDGVALPQLYASIVSQSGLPSPEFPISAAIGLPRDVRSQRIQAAFDGANWLVVWADDRAVGPGIRGSIISTTGVVLGGNDFLVSPTSAMINEDPLVSFNGIDYIVAWQDTPPRSSGGSQVHYTRVTTAGAADIAFVVPADATPINQALLFLSPQKPTGDTLLIYRDNNELPVQTRSVRIGIDAVLRDPGGTAMFKENQAESGFGRPIGVTFVAPEWHILSSFDQTVDSSIYLHKISTVGIVTVPTGKFAEMGIGPIGATAFDSFAPAFAGAGEWLFVRNEKINSAVYHLIGKRVTFEGVDKDPDPFQIDSSTQGILRSAVAAQSGSYFLTAWLDGRRSATQPGDARNIVAALIDATAAAGTSTALIAAVTASPLSGEAPLAVAFDSVTSTGTFDTLTWDFGDGTTSTSKTISHTYKNNGTYTAILKLTKGAYSIQDSVAIVVGGGSGTGSTGGTQVGDPVENSPGMVTAVFIASATVKLNLTTTGKDAALITGTLDIAQLPEQLTGIAGSVTVGSKATSFNLDNKAQFKNDSTRFLLNQKNGDFVFEVVGTELRATMDALGAKNETVSGKPVKIVNIPITVAIDKFSALATVGASYRAVIDVAASANFGFIGSGTEVSGSFLIQKFNAKEERQESTKLKVHSYSIKGQVKKPNAGIFKRASAGTFVITVGNFVLALPVGQFKEKDGRLTFLGRLGISGLKKFNLDLNSGTFNLQMLKVPADIVGGSGMPLARSGGNITKVDLNLSFQFDQEDGKFSAGRYIFIERRDAASKNWKLR